MKVVRIDTFGSGYTDVIPLEKIERIRLNKNGPDQIVSKGVSYDCFGGRFAIYNMDEFEGSGI